MSIKTFTHVKARFYLQVNNLSGFTHHLPGDEKVRQGTVRDNRPMEASMVMALRPPYCKKLQNSTAGDQKGHSKNPSNIYGLPSRELTYPPDKAYLKMIFLFPRWDMLISWRVCTYIYIYIRKTHEFSAWQLGGFKPPKTQVMSLMYIQPTKQGSKCCSDLKLEGTKKKKHASL